MGKTSYQTKWHESFPWLAAVKSDIYKAYCKQYLKTFRKNKTKQKLEVEIQKDLEVVVTLDAEFNAPCRQTCK